MLNIRSTAAELAGTPKYFLAISAIALNLTSLTSCALLLHSQKPFSCLQLDL
jgi:hypothetical protein